MIWTIYCNGVEKTLAALGIRSVSIARNSLTADELTFEHVVDKFETDQLFAHQAKIILYKQTVDNDPGTKVQYFVGWVASVNLNQASESESHSYVVEGPWYWLDRLVFQKPWFQAVDPANPQSALVAGYLSQVIMNVGVNGLKLTTKQQIEEVITYANTTANLSPNTLGDFIQAGANFPALDIPIDERVDITCAEAIRQQLRWIPDAVSVFDYSTTPPTLNILRRADMTAVDLTLSTGGSQSGNSIQSAGITPRYDLQAPAVVLKYQRVNTENGTSFKQTIVDKFPLNASDRVFNALPITINLTGYSLTIDVADIVTATWGIVNLNDVNDWFYKKLTTLNNDRIDRSKVVAFGVKLQYEDGTTYDYATNAGIAPNLLKEIISGTILDGTWTRDYVQQVQVESKQYSLRVDVSYSEDDGAVGSRKTKIVSKPYTIKFTATNAATGTYRRIRNFSEADPIPVGLAEQLYIALNRLQYDGSIKIKSAEVASTVTMGNKLNLFGGRAEWEDMQAIVQNVRESIDTGEKTVTIGVQRQLSAGDMVELLMVNRVRRSITAPETVATGRAPANEVELPQRAAIENSAHLDGHMSAQVWTNSDVKNNVNSGGNTSAHLDTDEGVWRLVQENKSEASVVNGSSTGNTKVVSSEVAIELIRLNGKKLYIREMDVCINGSAKKALFLMCDPY